MVDIESYGESSHHASTSGGSGLRLVLPSLKTVQALKGKKRQRGASLLSEEPAKKIPRPIKLKPLKEVLTKLIVQIKKKDDYAFFLQPVDVTQVTGYTDVVKRPMDLGTMTTKVEKGKYRSLEEFSDDLRLVTGNAKTFNPPGTIYHIEADRLETWSLEHIAKAASSVIEYEADWNIEIERDDDDDDGIAGADKGTPMDADEAGSVTSLQTPVAQPQVGGRRRGGASATKKPPGALSESLEEDGGLPGAQAGLGAFPPGSDWAEVVLALKLRGKRHRTKKERLRMERGGPPYRADGSLDYAELDNPFSVLSFFVREQPSRPLLTPLHPPIQHDPSQPPLLAPVNIPVDLTAPALSVPSLAAASSTGKGHAKTRSRRRHWTITRTAPSRGKGKEREDEDEDDMPAREPLPEDFGTFATLPGLLGAERRVADVQAELGEEQKLFDALRESVEGQRRDGTKSQVDVKMSDVQAHWSGTGDAAEDYLRDAVYSGVDGLAYVRSLAEFVHLQEPLDDVSGSMTYSALGMPLAKWVEEEVVNPLTDGRHRILSETARRLHDPWFPVSSPVAAQLRLSLDIYPRVALELSELRRTLRDKIDMVPLIHVPEELYLVEHTWTGKAYQESKRREEEDRREQELAGNAAELLKFAIKKHREAQASVVQDDPEVLQYVMGRTADTLQDLLRQSSVNSKKTVPDDGEGDTKSDQYSRTGGEDLPREVKSEKPDKEDERLRQLRLDLLALAKRTPLDQISRLPRHLVPEHLRSVVPTDAT